MTHFPNAVSTAHERHDSMLREFSTDVVEAQTGDVESPNGWIGLVTINTVLLETYAVTHGEDVRDFTPGVYLLRINSDGLIWGMRYATREKADSDFAALDVAYDTWMRESDAPETLACLSCDKVFASSKGYGNFCSEDCSEQNKEV